MQCAKFLEIFIYIGKFFCYQDQNIAGITLNFLSLVQRFKTSFMILEEKKSERMIFFLILYRCYTVFQFMSVGKIFFTWVQAHLIFLILCPNLRACKSKKIAFVLDEIRVCIEFQIRNNFCFIIVNQFLQ